VPSRSFLLFASAILLLGCTIPLQQTPAGPAGNNTTQPPPQPPAEPPAQNQSPSQNQTPSQNTSQTQGQAQGQTQNQTQAQNQTQNQSQEQPPATSLKSEEVSYLAGAWRIYGTLYDSKDKTPAKAVILLHQLGKTRDSYPVSFIESLHEHIPDALVLAIDMRGHGESTNLGTWQSFDTSLYRDMKTDILSAKKNLFEPNYPNVEEYYVVGASIGSTAALNAAAQEKMITKVVMISPGMEYKGVDITDSADEYRHSLLLVASSSDSYSVQAVNEIDALSSSPGTATKIYTGSAHGTDLFDATKDDSEPLSAAIVDFLK
jgi:pimeloyl-ACP methyl ester carboxylesterase